MSIREEVLQALEKSAGSIVSGNALAETLGVSRAAVWKTVDLLRSEGYSIDAVRKKGYRMNGDTLSVEKIYSHVKDSKFWGNIQLYGVLTSTNTMAKDLAETGAQSGTVVVAERQTAGKGRLGRSFFSPARSGAYMSAIIRLPQSIEESMLITSAAAVAVCRAIRTVTGLKTQIKWVNDVYYQDKKLCGILAEAAMNFDFQKLDYVVIGIGVNVTAASFPSELEHVATSLETALKQEGSISRCALIGEILNELQALSAELETRSFLEEYRSLSCVLGEEIDVITSSSRKRGRAVDINENGHLLVRMADGDLRTLSSGEVSIRPVRAAGKSEFLEAEASREKD